jgi:hypothetical protein
VKQADKASERVTPYYNQLVLEDMFLREHLATLHE